MAHEEVTDSSVDVAALDDEALDDEALDDETLDEGTETAREGRLSGLAIVLLVSGVIGFVASMILTIDRFKLLVDPQAQLACDISPFVACGPVMLSKAGALLGFPNPLLGIAGFAVLLTIGAALVSGAEFGRWFWGGLQIGVVLAAAFISFLQFQSLFVIDALCIWCITVWIVTIPVVVTVTVRNLRNAREGSRPRRVGQALGHFQGTVVVVWYLLVLALIGLRFYRDFALLWFGVAL